METISGIIEPNAGEDRKIGHHILRSPDSNLIFILSSHDLHLDLFLRAFVLAVGYRTDFRGANGRVGFVVVSLMPGDAGGGARDSGETERGVLKALELNSHLYGTHALYDSSGEVLAALQSDLIKLDAYIDKPVVVKGHASTGYPHQAGPVLLNVTDVCISMASMPGEKFDISLRVKDSTTHTWALSAISDRPVVELAAERFVADDEVMEGGPGTALFSFWTTFRGTTTLTFRKSRAWEPEKAISEIKYLVVSE